MVAGAEIGGELRRARIARKQSVEDIARATKITPTLIRAIESEDFAKLPGGLFTRGYLRAYAREVGVDPEEIVARYRAEVEPQPAAEAEETEGAAHSGVDEAKAAVNLDDTMRSRQVQVLQLCVILLIVALYFAVSRRPASVPQSDVKPVAPVAVAEPKPERPVATNGTVAPAPQGPLTLELRPQGPCWVEVTSEGQRVFGRLMEAGQRETLTIKNEATLRVGDPGAFAFTIDGVEGRQVGEPGRPTWVRIDRQNYKTFLKSQGAGPQG